MYRFFYQNFNLRFNLKLKSKNLIKINRHKLCVCKVCEGEIKCKYSFKSSYIRTTRFLN